MATITRLLYHYAVNSDGGINVALYHAHSTLWRV